MADPVSLQEQPESRYTVTVDRDGVVIFIGSPTGPQDTFAIVTADGKPTRLLCSVTESELTE